MEILAISGGSLETSQTMDFDRFAVDLTGRTRPRALFIPTASGDAAGYRQTFRRIYGDVLGCQVDELVLGPGDPGTGPAEKIGVADLIYVGGGNTLRMMSVWRRTGVDTLLREASSRPVVLAGLSAGAIAWYDAGHSDSRQGAPDGFIRVRALGLVPGVFCPHFDTEDRDLSFRRMVTRTREVGWGCDDLTALWHRPDGTVRVRTLGPRARVRRFSPGTGGLEVQVFGDGDAVP